MTRPDLAVQGQAAAPVGRNGRARFLLFVATAITPLILGVLYSALFLKTADINSLPIEQQAHLALEIACTYVVCIFAWRVHGQFDHKLGQVIAASAMCFGVLAMAILGGRWFFSRVMLFTAFPVATLLGVVILTIKQRISGPRVCVIAPLTGAGRGRFGHVITDPAADLRGYDIVLVSLGESVGADWAKALSRAMLTGAKVRHIGEYEEEIRGAVSLEHFELDHVSGRDITSYRPLKRFLDVAAVLLITPVGLPVLLLSMAAVLVTMGRPVFFTQQRVGAGGQVFRMWKLRTMRNAEPGEAVTATLHRDSRITLVGGFLRRFRLDELPQGWNVLKGDMSLIGPRPEAVTFHEDYLRETPAWAYRNLVRPGITGWAQVSTTPSSNAEEARRKLTYDLYYVKRLSLYLDIKIALRTVWTIVSGGGVR